SYLYKVDDQDVPQGLVSANASIWSRDTPVLVNGTSIVQNNATNGQVWRKSADYQWMPNHITTDGMTPLNSFVSLNHSTPNSQHLNWNAVSRTTLFDPYSKVLVSTDFNGMKISTRYGYKNSKAVLVTQNAGYDESVF